MDVLTLEVTDLDDEARGVASHEGAAVHVAGAWPGETVRAELEHRSPHKPEAWARLLTVDRGCAARVAPVCPATGRCGGCPLGTLSYEAQLAYKQARLVKAVAGIEGAAPGPIVASPAPLRYRSFAKLVYGPSDAGVCLGGYAPRSHALVDLAGCQVVTPTIEAVRAALVIALRALEVVPYDETSGQGLLSYVALRENARGEVLGTLVGTDLDALATLAPRLLAAHPALVGIAGNLRARGNAIFGAETRTIAGLAELQEQVGAASLLLSPTAFFQVNRAIAARIYGDLADAIVSGIRGATVDLYAGVGGITQTLAARGVTALVGIEVNPAAARDASRAAERGKLAARFVATDAAAGLRTEAERGAIDTIIVNPPRRGLDEAVRTAISAARPAQLAYVSCDPDSLARDLAILVAGGLRVRQLGAYDMHPQTAHIETLAILARAR